MERGEDVIGHEDGEPAEQLQTRQQKSSNRTNKTVVQSYRGENVVPNCTAVKDTKTGIAIYDRKKGRGEKMEYYTAFYLLGYYRVCVVCNVDGIANRTRYRLVVDDTTMVVPVCADCILRLNRGYKKYDHKYDHFDILLRLQENRMRPVAFTGCSPGVYISKQFFVNKIGGCNKFYNESKRPLRSAADITEILAKRRKSRKR